ncbi:hypothetical protein [Kordiimonas gwangyangensis]|uniref:hypothetical protein n=1 Tax=Kordiimonas gwangyangensis TaxID=288022 RepID=UPI00037F8CAD|nr:hypothetical protein [Kordiimonas gwangyangensis]
MTRIQQRKEAVIARKEWLETINHSIDQYTDDTAVLDALSSQVKFAAFTNEHHMAMSLNALKRQADAVLEGGFLALEQLRRSVHIRLNKKRDVRSGISRDTVRDLKRTNTRLRERLQSLHGELMVSTNCIRRILREFEEVVRRCGDSKELARYQKLRRELLALFMHGISTDEALARFDNVVDLKNVQKR